MGKTLKFLLVAVVAWLLWWLFVSEGAEVSAEVGGSVASKYVWRGLQVEGGPVIQAEASATVGAFTAGWWGNVSTTRDVAYDPPEFTEHDLSLEAELPVTLPGDGRLSAGVVFYRFENQAAEDTAEVYATLEFGAPWLMPAVSVWRDVDEAGGWYTQASAGHEFELGSGVGLGVLVFAGAGDSQWNAAYYDGSAGLVDVGVELSLPIELGAWSITPVLVYSDVPRAALGGSTEVYSGVYAARAW